MDNQATDLSGITVLLAQPEPFLADYLGHSLARAGASVVGLDSAPSCDPVTTIAAIDVSVADSASAGLHDIPVVLLSHCPQAVMPDAAPGRPMFQRPFAAFQVLQAIEAIAIDRLQAGHETVAQPIPAI